MTTNPKPERTKFRLVIFHSRDGSFRCRIPVDDDLAAHARVNPGVLSIEDAHTGATLWPGESSRDWSVYLDRVADQLGRSLSRAPMMAVQATPGTRIRDANQEALAAEAPAPVATTPQTSACATPGCGITRQPGRDSMTTALERLTKLRDHLLSLDSGSGEAADLTLVLEMIVATRELAIHYCDPLLRTSIHRKVVAYWERLLRPHQPPRAA